MSQDQQQEQSLTLGDRINYPFILANHLLKFGDSIIQPEGNQSEQQVRESALVLFYSIPDLWILKDTQFRRELDSAILKRKVDSRPIWCGTRIGPPKTEEIEEVQPYRLYNACVNVFQRRGLLSKTIYSENIVPTPESLAEEGKQEIEVTDEDQKELIKLKAIFTSEKFASVRT